MFDQSFVNTDKQTGKPISVVLSFLLQCLAAALAILLSIAYRQTLPGAQLRSLLVAPRAPVAQPAPAPAAKSNAPATPAHHRLVLLTPIIRALQYRPAAPVDPAPSIGDPFDGVSQPGAGPALPDGIENSVGIGTKPPLPAQRIPPKEATRPQRVSAGVAAAHLVYKVTPQYPRIAVVTHVQGTVHFRAVISREGRVEELEVLSGHPLLVNAARDAVLQWRYRPTLLNGIPVDVITDIEVHFTLNN